MGRSSVTPNFVDIPCYCTELHGRLQAAIAHPDLSGIRTRPYSTSSLLFDEVATALQFNNTTISALPVK